MLSYDLESYRNYLSFECVNEEEKEDFINNTYLDEKLLSNRVSNYSELYFEEDNISMTIIISYEKKDIMDYNDNKFLPITKLKFKTCFVDYNKCNCNNTYRNHTKDIMMSGYIDANESIEIVKNCDGYTYNTIDDNNTLIKLLNYLPYNEYNLEITDDGIKEYESDTLISYFKDNNLFIKV